MDSADDSVYDGGGVENDDEEFDLDFREEKDNDIVDISPKKLTTTEMNMKQLVKDHKEAINIKDKEKRDELKEDVRGKANSAIKKIVSNEVKHDNL